MYIPRRQEKHHLFEFFDAIGELGGPLLVQDSMMISLDELEDEVSKLRDKWVREFDNLTDFFNVNMREWTLDYVSLNNDIFVIIFETWE